MLKIILRYHDVAKHVRNILFGRSFVELRYYRNPSSQPLLHHLQHDRRHALVSGANGQSNHLVVTCVSLWLVQEYTGASYL